MQIIIKCGKNLNFAPITSIQTIKFGTFMQITSLKDSTIDEKSLIILCIVFFEVWRKLQIVLIIQQLFVSHY